MNYTFSFIGAGNMGGALLKAVAENNPDIKIAVFDTFEEKAKSFANKYDNVFFENINTVVTQSEYVFIGVKPQMLETLFEEISPLFNEHSPILISMAAGTSIQKIERLSKKEIPVIRIMPNTPVSVGAGMILYCKNSLVTKTQTDKFISCLSAAGLIDEIEENKIDAASAVTGCGPAFCCMFTEALADAAVECGIPRDKAIKYAAKMISGTAELILQTETHPAVLKDAVCSPGGTTIAGVHALENGAFRNTVMNSVVSAYKRTLELK